MEFNPQNEILIGTNAEEGAAFVLTLFSEKIRSNFSVEHISELLDKNGLNSSQEYKELFFKEAFGDIDRNNSRLLWKRLIKILGDVIFVCSDYLFINSFANSGRNVYYYEFEPKPSLVLTPWTPKWTEKASHFDEVPFVFGRPLLRPQDYTRSETDLSKYIMNSWVNFAKTGYELVYQTNKFFLFVID